MTAPAVPTALPDLSTVTLDEMPAPATLDAIVQRVLPGPPAVTVPGPAFSSAI